ncbi:hypothetical protein EDD15DRAFT_2518927 [Pisolithus albus]|nr:hypothetical protein EDD15DRAFT_2518927 [Pisolithus albus]
MQRKCQYCHTGPRLGDTTSIDEAPERGRLSSFHKPHYPTGGLPAEEDHDPFADWRLDDPPSVNSTGHLIFETVSSLLQHWPNTPMRNGHNIVPGMIPTGTLLYHGTWHSELPPGPEHSAIFCGGLVEGGRCWHLTLMTTRPLNIVHFDGTSVAKLPSGTLDSQDIVTWGDVRRFDEWNKITTLMEMSFEVMLCNFTSGVYVVSFPNIVDPVMPRNASSGFPPTFEVISCPLWEGKVDQQLLNISTEDAMRVRARLEEVLSGPTDRSSGIDWQALIVVDRYSERLEFVQYFLNFTGTNSYDADSVIDDAIKTQAQLRNMLMPYIGLDVAPRLNGTNVKEMASDMLDWARPVYKLCATTHTSLLKEHTVTSSEKLLLDAVQETTRES